MVFLAIVLAVWVPIMMSPWIIVGPWRVMKHFFFNWTVEIAYVIILVIMIAVFAVASTSWIIVGPWRLAQKLRG